MACLYNIIAFLNIGLLFFYTMEEVYVNNNAVTIFVSKYFEKSFHFVMEHIVTFKYIILCFIT